MYKIDQLSKKQKVFFFIGKKKKENKRYCYQVINRREKID